MIDLPVPMTRKDADPRAGLAASILPGELSPVESTRALVRRARVELQLGHDERARSDLEQIVQRVMSSSADAHAPDAGDRMAVAGSAFANLARARRSESDPVTEMLYKQADALFRSAIREQGTLTDVEQLEHALARAKLDAVDEAVAAAAQVITTSPETAGLWTELGNTIARAGRSDEGVDMLRRAVAADPQPATLTALADALGAAGATDEAIQHHRRAAERLAAGRRYADAIASFESVLALAPHDVDARMRQAELHVHAERPTVALRTIDAVLADSPGLTQALVIRGLILLELERPTKALDAIDQASDGGADAEQVTMLRTVALSFLGRDEDALATIEAAPAEVRANEPLCALHAEVLHKLGRNEEALRLLQQRHELPSSTLTLRLHASILRQLGRVEEALAAIDRSLADEPSDAELLAMRGEHLRLLGREDEAALALRQSLELAPDVPLALGTLGQVLASSDPQEAIRCLRRALELDPSMGWAWDALIRVLRSRGATGEIEDALREIEQLLKRSRDPELLSVRARTLAMLERYDEAVAALEEALRIEERPDLIATLGEALRRLGRLDEAHERLDRAVALDPENAYALGTRGQVLLAKGEREAGIEELRVAHSRAPELLWITLALFEALVAARRFDQAVELLAADERVSRDELRHRLTKAIEALSAGDAEDLIGALERQPTWDVGQAVVAHRMLERGDHDAALAAIDGALHTQPEWVNALLLKARILEAARGAADRGPAGRESSGSEDDLAKVLARLRRLAPDAPAVVGAEARRLLRTGSADRAEAILRKLVERTPRPEAFEQLGELLVETGRYADALEVFDAAIARGDEPASVGAFRGRVLRLLGRADEAVVELEGAIERGANYAWTSFELVMALLDTQEELEALKLAARAASRGPGRPVMLALAGSICFDLAEFEAAMDYCDTAISQGLKLDWVFGHRGALHLIEKRFERALPDFREARRLTTRPLGFRKSLAEVVLAQGDRERARTLYAELLDDVHRDIRETAFQRLTLAGWCSYRLGRFGDAVSSLSEALAIDNLHAATQLDLGLVMLCDGDGLSAHSEYARGIMVAEQSEGLRARSVLRFARRDLREAREQQGDALPEAYGPIEAELTLAIEAVDAKYETIRQELGISDIGRPPIDD